MAPSPRQDRPSLAAVIVAAGMGVRAGQAVPKQFALWRGKPVLRHAAEALVAAGVTRLIVTIPENMGEVATNILSGLDNVSFVTGGATRQESVRAALEILAADPPAQVLIHDAARPDCPPEVVERLLAALADHAAAIPVLPVIDSIVRAEGAMMGCAENRDLLRRVQTPQAFCFRTIMGAHRTWNGPANAGDDAQILAAQGVKVALIAGDERLHKLTTETDFRCNQIVQQVQQIPRTGTGFDVHRLVAGEELWLCGIRIDHPLGLSGHSDADVGLHAVVDAILGACAAGDIGDHFPPSDPQWRGAPSSRFVEHARALAHQRGFAIGNVDLTLMCEAPRIGPHRDAMRARLAELLGVGVEAVSVKATTTERLGFTGRGEGIAAQAVATLVPLQKEIG